MSGIFEKKKSKNHMGNRKKRKVLIAATTVLGLLLAILVALAIWMETADVRKDPNPDNGTTEPHAQTEATPRTEQTEPTETPNDSALQGEIDLGSGVKITGLISYTGAFMEDRTDEVVTDVLAIKVTNTGEEYIQTMDITLQAGDSQAQFSLSTLFPGETMVVLEKNRMAYSTAPDFSEAQTSAVALFDAHPGMCEDKLEIQCLDGVINVTNISGEDITGDILIYYKNYVSGMYYGGITYRLRIEGGLKAGEIRQGSAAHFNSRNSTVVFVTCG